MSRADDLRHALAVVAFSDSHDTALLNAARVLASEIAERDMQALKGELARREAIGKERGGYDWPAIITSTILLLREDPSRDAGVLCKLLKVGGIAVPDDGKKLRAGFNLHAEWSFEFAKSNPFFDPHDGDPPTRK